MKVLVFEHCLKITGHRLPYATMVADAFAAKGHDVVLGLPSVIEENARSCGYLSDQFRVCFYPTKVPRYQFLKAILARRCLARLIHDHRPDYVAIPTADGLATIMGLFSKVRLWNSSSSRIDICLMSGRKEFPNHPLKSVMANIKWNLIRSGPWQRILLIDPREWSNIENAESNSVYLCPDPVPRLTDLTKNDARKILGLPLNKKIIVSVGGQSVRKGVDLLVNAFATIASRANAVLVLFGKLDTTIQKIIDELAKEISDKIIIANRFVTDDEFQQAILASDIVAVPYRSTNQPSGIVCRCMAWNRPMLMTNQGWLKWIREKYNAGFGVNPFDCDEFSCEILAALNECDAFKVNDDADEFIKYNTEKNYKDVWVRGISTTMKSDDQ